MNPEDQIISVLEEATHARERELLTLDIIGKKLNTAKLAKLAQQLSAPNRLGFLVEVSAIASKNKGLQASERLYKLAEILYRDNYSWAYLNPDSPDFAKRIISVDEQPDLNKKWRVYSTLTSEQVEDLISLYWDDFEDVWMENETYR